MNRGNPAASLVIAMLLLGGLYAITSVLLTDGNTIGQMCRFLMGAGFLLCLVAPRAGFTIWLVACGYNDLLKRLMVIGGRVSEDDLKYVLGITPVMFGGVVMSLVIGGLMQSRPLSGADWRRFVIGVGLMLMAGVLAGRQEGAGFNGILQAIANNGLYSLLIFVLPVLFRQNVEVLRIWRFLVLAFLPVAAYGVVQQICGFADFEVEYLLSGLSIEIKQLYADEVRAFSTLNSPTALSVVCACLAVISLNLGWAPRRRGTKAMIAAPLALVCFLIHCAGLMASTSRMATLIVLLAPLGGWCFSSTFRTRVFYGLTLGSFGALVLISPWLAENLDAINLAVASAVPSGSFLSRMLIIGTYWDRLQGFATVLMNPAAWTLFGMGPQENGEGIYHYHDPISAVLVKHGALALLGTLVSLWLLLRSVHRRIFEMQSPSARFYAAHMTALVFSMLVVSAVGGSVLTVFPNNVILWASISTIMIFSRRPVPGVGETGVETPAPASVAPAYPASQPHPHFPTA